MEMRQYVRFRIYIGSICVIFGEKSLALFCFVVFIWSRIYVGFVELQNLLQSIPCMDEFLLSTADSRFSRINVKISAAFEYLLCQLVFLLP